MQKPPFEKIRAVKIDEFLFEFFVKQMGYERIDKDTDAANPEAPDAWRMVVPVENSRPFAIAYQANLSKMKNRKEVIKLYGEKVVPHRNEHMGAKDQPVLYGFTDGARLVFFSADTGHNRDDRFDLTEETWAFKGFQEKVARLRVTGERTEGENGRVRYGNLEFQKRVGRLRPIVDFLFATTPLSSDSRFKAYAHEVRRSLMKEVLADEQARSAVVYYLLEARDGEGGNSKTLYVDKKGQRYTAKKPFDELYVELGMRLGEAVSAAVDTLLLRLMMVRFLEAYDQDAIKQSIFSDGELEGLKLIGPPLNPGKPRARKPRKLGGDFYLADLGKAAREVVKILLKKRGSLRSVLLQDFLVRTGDSVNARWEFRYEDLKPKTLQDYYEDSLSTAVQYTYNRSTKQFDIDVITSNRQRKGLGAYYTNEQLCRFMVEQTVEPLFDERLERLRKAVAAKNAEEARRAFDAVINFSVCDPTMGSAPFLRSAFHYLSDSTIYYRLCGYVRDAKENAPAFYQEVARDYPFLNSHGGEIDPDGLGGWEWHVLRRMLYGVDIDLKAVCIASQTFALSSIGYVKQGERFPSFFNINLKVGNALISPTKPWERAELARKYGAEIAKLISLRRRAQTLQNTEEAYAELLELFKEADEIRRPILDELIDENLYSLLKDFTDSLRPFCWEIEFPEVYFNNDGSLKSAAGFDVVIGNPPWEGVKLNDEDFFRPLDESYPKSTRKAQIKAELLDNSAVAHVYKNFGQAIKAQRQFYSKFKLYTLQGSMGLNQLNLYKVSLERYLQLNSQAGRLSVVIPGGILCDTGCATLRQELLERHGLESVRQLWTNDEIFPDIHKDLPVAVLSIKHSSGPTTVIDVAANLVSFSQLKDTTSAQVPTKTISELNPYTRPIPLVRSEADLELLHRLSNGDRLSDIRGPWRIKAGIELFENNSTADMRSTTAQGPLILKGAMVFPYRIDMNAGKQIRLREEFLDRFPGIKRWRLVHRDANDIVLARRVYATLCPPGFPLFDSIEVLESELDIKTLVFLCSVLNSLTTEWRFRLQSTNNHIRSQLADITLEQPGSEILEAVCARAGRLLVDGGCLPPAHYSQQFARMNKLFPSEVKDFDVIGQLGEAEKIILACEIDALVACHYKLSAQELDLILSWFQKVPEETKALVRSSFARLSANK